MCETTRPAVTNATDLAQELTGAAWTARLGNATEPETWYEEALFTLRTAGGAFYTVRVSPANEQEITAATRELEDAPQP